MIPLMRSIRIATVQGSGVPQVSSPVGVSGAPQLNLLHGQLRLNPGESGMLGSQRDQQLSDGPIP